MGRSARSLRWWVIAVPAVVLAVLVTAALLTSGGPGLGPASAPLARPPEPSVHVVAAGDFGSSADAAAVLSRTAELAPDAAFAVGDLSYSVAPESAWCSFASQRLGPGMAFELLSGNHESDGYNGSIEDFAACLPNRLPGLVGTYGREYYVDLPADKPVMRVINTSAGLHFPEGTWDYSAGDVHYTWTAAAIDSARAKGISWVMVNNHYPCLGMAAYACVMPHDFYDLLQDRRVDLVVDGHDHAYMRSHQLAGGSVGCPRIPTSGYDADCVADSDNAYAAGRGTVFATVGTGGRALRPINLADPDRPNFAAWSGSNANPTYGVLDLVATQSELTARFVRASGGTFDDSFTITRDPPPIPPPPSEPLVFVPLPAARVLDTRSNQGGAGPLGAAEQRRISVAAAQDDGSPVVPAGALAVAVNLTAPRPSASGHFRLMPGTATGLTAASAINFRSRESIANGLTTRLAPDRTLKLYNGAAVPVDAVVDVVGYFAPAAGGTPAQLAGGLFTPLPPTRVYDSVQSGAATAGGASTAVELASVVPPGASAVAYNITVVDPAAAGHLRVHRAGTPLPESSTINFAAGDRVANATSVQVGEDRRLEVYNSGGAPVRFLIDVVGFYSGSGAHFRVTDPVRVLDTRLANGGMGPLPAGAEPTVSVAAAQGEPAVEAVPIGATAVECNVTAVRTGGSGHLRVWPGDGARPAASVLNWPGSRYTRANGSAVGIGADRNLGIYNGSGGVLDVLVDVNGFYEPYQPHSQGPQPAFSQ